MNRALRAVLVVLLNKRYIGWKHTPEDKLIKSKTKWLEKKEHKDFEKEYKKLINKDLILRLKKRTGKGSDWHISLNPRKLKEIYRKIGDDQE